MVRVVSGDEAIVEGFIDRQLQSGISLQVGLAIGRLGSGSSRDFIFALIPTPGNEGQDVVSLEGEPEPVRDSSKRKTSKAKAVVPQILHIDMEWVAEHARQVSKMLVGGVNVVGIYILANETVFKNSTAFLWQTSKMVAATAQAGCTTDEFLLIHFSFSPRRISCRSCTFESGFNASLLRPCDWKLIKSLPALYSINCSYMFDIRVPVYVKQHAGKSLFDVILSAVSLEALRLESAIAIKDGALVNDDKALVGESNHEVDIFVPFNACKAQMLSNGDVNGIVILSGSVRACAYSFSRDLLSRAIADLKADIVKSIQSRLEIIYDDIDSHSTDTPSPHPLQRDDFKTEYRFKLPRRVFTPWVGGVLICDYMQEGENLQDLNGRCKELLGIDILANQLGVLEYEDDSVNLRQSDFWEISNASKSADETMELNLNEQVGHVVASKPNHFNISAISLLVVLVACIVAYVLTVH